jgi:MarR family transcriptional regulator, organic hydroperoxide resistance regulator
MKPAPAADSEDAISALLRLANAVTRDLAPVFEKANITPQQWMLLSTLAAIEDVPTLAGLARQMTVSKQNVTGMIRRLEDAGFVAKADDPDDLRSQRVTLTRRGSELVNRLGPRYRKWIDEFLGRLDPEDRKTFERAVALLGSE